MLKNPPDTMNPCRNSGSIACAVAHAKAATRASGSGARPVSLRVLRALRARERACASDGSVRAGTRGGGARGAFLPSILVPRVAGAAQRTPCAGQHWRRRTCHAELEDERRSLVRTLVGIFAHDRADGQRLEGGDEAVARLARRRHCVLVLVPTATVSTATVCTDPGNGEKKSLHADSSPVSPYARPSGFYGPCLASPRVCPRRVLGQCAPHSTEPPPCSHPYWRGSLPSPSPSPSPSLAKARAQTKAGRGWCPGRRFHAWQAKRPRSRCSTSSSAAPERRPSSTRAACRSAASPTSFALGP